MPTIYPTKDETEKNKWNIMKAIKVDVKNDANHSFGRDLELGTISFGSSLSTHHAKSIETILPR